MPLYHPVWVSTSGRVSLRWGAACADPVSAKHVGMAEVRAGRATLSFVVEEVGGERTPLAIYTYPEAARKVVRHWEALWDATEAEHR